MFKIGNIEINSQVVLAPMAGITNLAYRKLVREYGSFLMYGEMISDKALLFGNKKTFNLLKTDSKDHILAQQIFGSNPRELAEAAKIVVKEMSPDIIDINMGCSVPKVSDRAKSGAYLLKYPEKIYEIVKAVKEAVEVPVTVKIRIGWDDDSNLEKIVGAIERGGADAICVHGRTKKQMYRGKADLDAIKFVKEIAKIPVIGNGDVVDEQSARHMLEYTKVDAVMIGRAAMGNPFIFREIDSFLKTNKLIEKPNYDERINKCIKHFHNLLKDKKEKEAILEMRTHISAYVKNLYNAKEYKQKLYKMEDLDDIIKSLEEYKEKLREHDNEI